MMQSRDQFHTVLERGVSIVVPVYNGANTIGELAERVAAAMGDDRAWELIFVVDGSPDLSWHTVEALVDRYPKVIGIDMYRNFGQHNALLAGVRAARYDVIVTMDDDLQHRPETIGALVDALVDDVDLVFGVPIDEEHGIWRSSSSRVVKAAMAMTISSDMTRVSGAFRAFRTSIRDGFADVRDPYVSIDVLLSWVTTRYATVLLPMDQRNVGTSNYTFRRLVRHAANMITGYSTKPLRVVSWLGFALSLFGLLTLAFVVVRYFVSENDVPGFAFLASLISILAGAQLFGLGVIGEYLGRMHFRSMQRPSYVVRTVRRQQLASGHESDD